MNIHNIINRYINDAKYEASDPETEELAKRITKALKGKIIEIGPTNDLGSRTFHIEAKRKFSGSYDVIRNTFRAIIWDQGTCNYYKSKFKTPCQYIVLSERRTPGSPGQVAIVIDKSVSTGRPGIHVIVYDGNREDYNSPNDIVDKIY